jgi:Glycosyl transferase family 2
MSRDAPAAEPELSVVLTTDRWETSERILSHLRDQTAAERLELVLVAPSAADVARIHDGDGSRFHSVRVVEHDPRPSMAPARAAGAAAARGPLIGFAETHCFPDPEWAEALIEAHRGPWAVVGPEMHNGNPESAVSRAAMLIGYGPWEAPQRPGPVDHLPGRNSCYKRDALLDFRGELGALLDAETLIHWDLRSRGRALFLEPRARTRHLNTPRILPATVELFRAGRTFAALRARRWPFARRVLYAAATVGVPPLRLTRILRGARRRGRLAAALATLLPMAWLLAASATGELTGYLFGGSVRARRLLAKHELRASVESDRRQRR